MPELFESIVDQITTKTMGGLITEERKKDIALIGKSWDFYDGNQQQYIKQYRGEENEDYADKDKPTFNYTKLIVDEYVSGVFGKPVDVDFGEDEYNERWGEIIAPISFSHQLPFMKRVQRISEVSEMCVVMVRWDTTRKIPFFEDIRGEFVSFLPKEENPKEIGTLIISYIYDTGIPDPTRRFMERIEIWNDEKWEVWIYSQNAKRKERIGQGENPYGVIPAIVFRPEDDDNTFFGKSGTKDVVVINEAYNNLWVSLTRISVMQSFSVLVIQSENDIQIEVAPTKFIRLPKTETAEVKYITPSAKINEVRQVLLSLKDDLQDFSRVPQSVFASQGSKGGIQSGYALKIKRIPIEQLWENRRTAYGPSYADLCSLVLHVDYVHRGKNPQLKFLEDVKPSVEFSSTTPGLSPQEQLVQDQFDLRYNLITPIDMMMRKYPGMGEEEALERIKENIEKNKMLGVHVGGVVDVTGDAAALENIMDEKREAEKEGQTAGEPTTAKKADDAKAPDPDMTDEAEE